ncbi:hypothetical protein BGX27_005242, partial [Mortierella sp. AM989]
KQLAKRPCWECPRKSRLASTAGSNNNNNNDNGSNKAGHLDTANLAVVVRGVVGEADILGIEMSKRTLAIKDEMERLSGENIFSNTERISIIAQDVCDREETKANKLVAVYNGFAVAVAAASSETNIIQTFNKASIFFNSDF